jgi:hypothetical protein
MDALSIQKTKTLLAGLASREGLSREAFQAMELILVTQRAHKEAVKIEKRTHN